ncbi:hypothetical protein GCM10020295_53020 [Streptomyces cinereospinus]
MVQRGPDDEAGRVAGPGAGGIGAQWSILSPYLGLLRVEQIEEVPQCLAHGRCSTGQ